MRENKEEGRRSRSAGQGRIYPPLFFAISLSGAGDAGTRREGGGKERKKKKRGGERGLR